MSEILGTFKADSYAFVDAPPAQNWIGGEWRPSTSPDQIDVVNPRHGKAMSRVPLSGAEDVDMAVKAAPAAFPEWRDRPMRERAHVLYRLRSLMEAEREALAWLVSHENGKVYAQALAEVDKAIECVEFAIRYVPL